MLKKLSIYWRNQTGVHTVENKNKVQITNVENFTSKQYIYTDDWNELFITLPDAITDHSISILQKGIRYHEDTQYTALKQCMHLRLLSIGKFEILAYMSGSQAIEMAILLTQQRFVCKKLFKMEKIYHGLNIQNWEEGITSICNMDIEYITISQDGEVNTAVLLAEENAIILIEPLYIFAKYGIKKMHNILKTLQSIAEEKQHKIIVDEVRSGVFKTGTFLLSEQVSSFKPAVICLSKGMALSVALSVCCFNSNLFPSKFLKNNDIIKSNLSLSALALQRAVDLLRYVADEMNENELYQKSNVIASEIKKHCNQLVDSHYICAIHVIGSTCVLVFNSDVSLSKRRSFRMFLLASHIIIRHFEDNLLYINFPLDIKTNQIDSVMLKIGEAVKLLK